jgi:hypothetical protein
MTPEALNVIQTLSDRITSLENLVISLVVAGAVVALVVAWHVRPVNPQHLKDDER